MKYQEPEKRELLSLEICDKLRKMKMSAMADKFQLLAQDPNFAIRDPLDIFSEITFAEWNLRHDKKIKQFLTKATLKYPSASFDDIIYNSDRMIDTALIERLATCQWIAEGRSLTVTGKAGTGKTYICCTLAFCTIQRFLQVKYIKASTLFNEIEAASSGGNLLQYQNQMASYDLLIIDDFGFMNLEIQNCLKLFELLDARECRKSTIVASQIPRENWYDLFIDSTYADACMERLTKSSLKLELNGPSLRT